MHYLDQIRTVLSFVFAITLMTSMLDCHINSQKKRVLTAGILVLYACFLMVFWITLDYHQFMEHYPLIVHLPTLFIFMYLSRFSPVKVIFIQLTFIAITTSFSLIAIVISSLWNYDRMLIDLICYALYLPTGLLFYRFVRPTFLYMLRTTNKGWAWFCIIPFSFTVITYSIGKYNVNTVISEIMVLYAIAIFILTLSAYALILRSFRQTREQFQLQNEQSILHLQVNAARANIEALRDSQAHAAIYRHDMRHHLNLISAYLVEKDYESAKRYITEINAHINDNVAEQFCENYAVNLIINAYASHARQEGIRFEAKLMLPKVTSVSDMDLCVLFSNALENALHACRNIPYTSERFIRIESRNKGAAYFLQIVNSCYGDVSFSEGLPLSNQKDHGLGTRSIAAIIEKYQGFYSFSLDDSQFRLILTF